MHSHPILEKVLHYDGKMAPTAPWLPVGISVASTTIALIAFTYQVHRARFNQSVDLLFRLENDFFGPRKTAQRSIAAQNYLVDPSDFKEMEDILDFFETIAMLTRKGALDIYMVWHTFDYWIERYCAAAQPYITERQLREPGVWEDLAWLLPRIRKLQARKHPSVLSTPEITAFMAEESAED
jgi:hypothetical protein